LYEFVAMRDKPKRARLKKDMRIHAENEFTFCYFDGAIFRRAHAGDVCVFFVPDNVSATITSKFFEGNVAEVVNDYDFAIC
jgi:hypothetical protein